MIGRTRSAGESWAPPLKVSALADSYGVDRRKLAELAQEVDAGLWGSALEKRTRPLIAETPSGELGYLSPARARRLAADLTCLWLTTRC